MIQGCFYGISCTSYKCKYNHKQCMIINCSDITCPNSHICNDGILLCKNKKIFNGCKNGRHLYECKYSTICNKINCNYLHRRIINNNIQSNHKRKYDEYNNDKQNINILEQQLPINTLEQKLPINIPTKYITITLEEYIILIKNAFIDGFYMGFNK